MTQEEYIDHWKHRLLGMALTGLVDDNDERCKGPLGAAARALELPPKVHKLLQQMWLTAQTTPPPPPASGNGSTTAGNASRSDDNGRQQETPTSSGKPGSGPARGQASGTGR